MKKTATRMLHGNKTDLTATVFAQDWHDTAGALKVDKLPLAGPGPGARRRRVRGAGVGPPRGDSEAARAGAAPRSARGAIAPMGVPGPGLGNWDMVRADTSGGGTFTTETKGHNLANEYTSKNGQAYYDHDDDGNLTDDGTLTFGYDYANHAVKAVRKGDSAVIAQYAYDALGRRVKKVVDDVSDTLDGTRLYYYDGLRVIERGKLDAQDAYSATDQHVWGLYLDEQLVYDHDADGDGDFDDIGGSDKRYYVIHDFLYSASAVIDATAAVKERYDYEPYGKPTFWSGDYSDTRDETQVTNILLFTGQMYDPESGLYHYKARALHPTLGRFLQRDPKGYLDSANLQEAVLSRPHEEPDPLGAEVHIQPGRRWGQQDTSGFADAVITALQNIAAGCAELYLEKQTPLASAPIVSPVLRWPPTGAEGVPTIARTPNLAGLPPGTTGRYALAWRLAYRNEDLSASDCTCPDVWDDLKKAIERADKILVTATGRMDQGFSYKPGVLTPELAQTGYFAFVGISPLVNVHTYEVFPKDPSGSGVLYYLRAAPFKVVLWHELIGHTTDHGDEYKALEYENKLRRCLFCRGEEIRRRYGHQSITVPYPPPPAQVAPAGAEPPAWAWTRSFW